MQKIRWVDDSMISQTSGRRVDFGAAVRQGRPPSHASLRVKCRGFTTNTSNRSGKRTGVSHFRLTPKQHGRSGVNGPNSMRGRNKSGGVNRMTMYMPHGWMRSKSRRAFKRGIRYGEMGEGRICGRWLRVRKKDSGPPNFSKLALRQNEIVFDSRLNSISKFQTAIPPIAGHTPIGKHRCQSISMVNHVPSHVQ